ncbi:MAG: sigma-54-dependent Fis family transcriptional regulator [Planctomycetota bacterium]|nr:MAG: sigma-54-dependent Fis family transcriptional regulator [Planctomycetota bacterium]
MPELLILEDEPESLTALTALVKEEGFEVTSATTIAQARRLLQAQRYDLLLLDISLPDGDGLSLFDEIPPEMEVVVITGSVSVGTVLRALRRGAFDFLAKPIDVAYLKELLAIFRGVRADAKRRGKPQLRGPGEIRIIGASPPFERALSMARRVAPTDLRVLITGESGTGKDCFAQAIHAWSKRASGPFVAVNCSAVSSSLMESELFGHERGSFTGATQTRRGLFEQASGGTLFLDEITEMSLEQQTKLLRVIETRRVVRVGAERETPVDVRILAATNRSPDQAVKERRLREDLFYRLKVFVLDIPPLRERKGDVALLAEYFLRRINTREGTTKRFSAASLAALEAYSWPGNVRELRSVVETAYVLAETDLIEMGELLDQQHAASLYDPGSIRLAFSVGTPLSEIERAFTLATLRELGGDKRKAAAMLGISLKTLYNRLRAYEREGHIQDEKPRSEQPEMAP